MPNDTVKTQLFSLLHFITFSHMHIHLLHSSTTDQKAVTDVGKIPITF